MIGILLTFVHIAVCIFLIIVVLLQSGKAADLAGAFGGSGSQTAFGPRGSATLLSKATTISAILFMVTSMSLSIVQMRNTSTGNSLLNRKPVKAGAPVSPAAAPKPVQQNAVPPVTVPMTAPAPGKAPSAAPVPK